MSITNLSTLALADIRPSKTMPDYFAMVSNAPDSTFNSSFSPNNAKQRVRADKNCALSGVSLVTSTTLSTPVGDVEIRVDEYVDALSNSPRPSKLTGGTTSSAAIAAKPSESSDSTRSSPDRKMAQRANLDTPVQIESRSANHVETSYVTADKPSSKLKTASSETTLDEDVFMFDDRRRTSNATNLGDYTALNGNMPSTDYANAEGDNDADVQNFRKKSSSEKLSSVRGTLRRALSSRRRHRRLIFKDGTVNISSVNVEKKKRRYLVDLFTTLVDIKWRYSLLLFTLTFICSWLFFACVWYVVSLANGDLDSVQQLANGSDRKNDTAGPPAAYSADVGVANTKCIEQVNSFLSAILFSIETQQTIGFGHRYVTDNGACAVWNILIMMTQSCCGVIIQALMTGIVFAKLSRPKKRAQTLMFSKNAVICMRDGSLCLLFRVGDMRKSHIINTHIRGILIQKRLTQEGEQLPLSQYEVDFGFTDGTDRPFLIWPVLVEHRITAKSPFWNMSARTLKRIHFELIVVLEGIVESTGMTTQARSSYLPGEILWGHRFEKLISYEKDNGQFHIDFCKFHETQKVDNFTMQSAAEIESSRQAAAGNANGASGVSRKTPVVTLNANACNDAKAAQLVSCGLDPAHLTAFIDEEDDAMSSVTCSSARSISFTHKNSDASRKDADGDGQPTPSDGSASATDKVCFNGDEKGATGTGVRSQLSPRRLSIPVDIGRPLPRRSSQDARNFGRRLQRLNPTSELSVSFSMLDK